METSDYYLEHVKVFRKDGISCAGVVFQNFRIDQTIVAFFYSYAMRSDQLLLIRPVLDLPSAISEAEQFQNQTLRPILKFQNDLLVELFKGYLIRRKAKFSQLTEQEKSDFITHGVQKDYKFRNLLIGLVVGHFTLQEWQQYVDLAPELSRRLCHLIIQRLDSQKDKFV